MSDLKVLSVQKRAGLGKGANRRARQEELIPGVFYTAKGDNIAVQAPALPLEKMYAEMGRTAVFNLEIRAFAATFTLLHAQRLFNGHV